MKVFVNLEPSLKLTGGQWGS